MCPPPASGKGGRPMTRTREISGSGQIFALLVLSQCFWLLCCRPSLVNGLLSMAASAVAYGVVFLLAVFCRRCAARGETPLSPVFAAWGALLAVGYFAVKLFIILGVTASALASVFRIILEPQTGFLVGNILSGFASAMWISFMVLYASYFTCENLQRAMGLIMAANNIGVLGGFVLSTLSYNHLGMNFLCLLSICSGVPAILLSFGIKEQKTKTVKIVPKTSDLIKVYADKRLIFFSILALVQQGILMATCMSFTTQIAHEINASAFQIGLLSIVYIIVAVLASYFSASNFARRLGSSLWIPFILFVLAIYCFAVPNIFSPNLLIAIQILVGLSTGIVFSFCTSEAMKNVPIEKRSTAMGYYQAIYAVGMTIVPMIAGNIAEIYSLNIAFYLEGIIAVIATVASMIYFKYDNRKTIKG